MKKLPIGRVVFVLLGSSLLSGLLGIISSNSIFLLAATIEGVLGLILMLTYIFLTRLGDIR